MRIEIVGWKYINIRKFENFEINLAEKSERITLLMMRNGTGKTTTIHLIRAALSGVAEEWDADEVRAFAPPNTVVKKGEFHLKIKYDQKLYHYILHLDYEMGKAYYETSRFERRGGLEHGRQLPHELKGLMNQENFVNRFIFDGEQARKTLGAGNREAEKSIVYLYQVNKLDELIRDVNDLVRRKQENSEKSLERSIKIYKSKMEKGEKNYCRLLDEQKRYRAEIALSEKALQDLEQRYSDIIAEDDKLEQEQRKLIEEEKEKKRQLSAGINDILKESKRPYNVSSIFDKRLKWLSKNMQILKLPKATAQEFFKELAESPRCICGHEIGEKERELILKNSEKYLGMEQFSILNAIKHKIREYECSDIIEQQLEKIEIYEDDLRKIHNDMERIAIEVASRGNTEVLEIKRQMQQLRENIFKYEDKCERLETKDYIMYPDLNENTNIEKARRFKENAKDNYLRVTDTYSFTKKAEKVIGYIKIIRENTLRNLMENILETANKKIKRIISNDSIEIEKIDGDLLLKGRKGLSEGRTLAVAYAYIGSLFEHSELEFPFVVDSPAASMDLEVRREVASVLPRLFQQLIIFVTSGEVAGFAESFYTLDDVRYLTIEERDNSVQCTEGQDYFSQFQVEEG